jgi:hypothetical protein
MYVEVDSFCLTSDVLILNPLDNISIEYEFLQHRQNLVH